MSVYSAYVNAIRDINPEIDPEIFLLLGVFVSAVLILYLGIFYDILLGFLVAVVVMDLILGYPLHKSQSKVAKVEQKLPDVLMHLATTLRAGGTIESGLKEVAGGRYGDISKEMRRMLLQMKEGKTFEEAFNEFADRSGSDIVRKTADVIVSAKRSGGGMATALTSIADDIREMYRLKKERIAKTTTSTLFIIIAADFVAPLIFGLVTGIMVFLSSVSGESVTPMFQSIIFYFKIYLAISAVFSALAASIIREGNVGKASLYAPFLLLLTYLIYQVVMVFAIGFFS
jgi:flagellar protein FlaJ